MNTTTSTKIMNKKKHLINKIREFDFALVETSLFLNTHPECQKALMYYSKIQEDYKKALNEYEKHFGPLNIYSAYNDKKWNWIDGPWPWEKES